MHEEVTNDGLRALAEAGCGPELTVLTLASEYTLFLCCGVSMVCRVQGATEEIDCSRTVLKRVEVSCTTPDSMH